MLGFASIARSDSPEHGDVEHARAAVLVTSGRQLTTNHTANPVGTTTSAFPIVSPVAHVERPLMPSAARRIRAISSHGVSTSVIAPKTEQRFFHVRSSTACLGSGLSCTNWTPAVRAGAADRARPLPHSSGMQCQDHCSRARRILGWNPFRFIGHISRRFCFPPPRVVHALSYLDSTWIIDEAVDARALQTQGEVISYARARVRSAFMKVAEYCKEDFLGVGPLPTFRVGAHLC